MANSPKAEKVAKASVVRELGWLYYIDKNGNVARQHRGKPPAKAPKPEIVAYTAVIRDENYIYFMDNDGDVARIRRATLENPSPVPTPERKTRAPRRKPTVKSKDKEDKPDDESLIIY